MGLAHCKPLLESVMNFKSGDVREHGGEESYANKCVRGAQAELLEQSVSSADKTQAM